MKNKYITIIISICMIIILVVVFYMPPVARALAKWDINTEAAKLKTGITSEYSAIFIEEVASNGKLRLEQETDRRRIETIAEETIAKMKSYTLSFNESQMIKSAKGEKIEDYNQKHIISYYLGKYDDMYVVVLYNVKPLDNNNSTYYGGYDCYFSYLPEYIMIYKDAELFTLEDAYLNGFTNESMVKDIYNKHLMILENE